MNRTESFMGLVGMAIAFDINNPTGWAAIAYIAMTAVLFVMWMNRSRTPPRSVNAELLECLVTIYNWTEHKETAWAKRAKVAIDNARACE